MTPHHWIAPRARRNAFLRLGFAIVSVVVVVACGSGNSAGSLDEHGAVKFLSDIVHKNGDAIRTNETSCILTSGSKDGPTANFLCYSVLADGTRGDTRLTCSVTEQGTEWECISTPLIDTFVPASPTSVRFATGAYTIRHP